MLDNQITGGAGRHPCGLYESDCEQLAKLPLFAGLERSELFRLIGEAWTEDRPADSLIFLDGDPATSLYVVLGGWVKLFRSTPDGNESVIAVISAGDSFAEAAVFEEVTYPVSAATVVDSRLLVIPAAPFLARMLEEGRLAIKMMASMSRRLRQLVHQVEDLSLKSSVERLAGYISGLCSDTSGATVVRLPLDKSLIARHLGMQPETLSRSFARLRGHGIVADGDRVMISDVTELQRFVGSRPSGGAGPLCQRPN